MMTAMNALAVCKHKYTLSHSLILFFFSLRLDTLGFGKSLEFLNTVCVVCCENRKTNGLGLVKTSKD